jgi:phosphoglycolate phosphatase
MADGKTKDALTLVFDLDGTLVDTAADLMGTLNMILAREGAQPLPIEKAHSLLGAGARALIERGFALDGRRLDEARMDLLYRDFLDHYAERIADESRPFDGVEAQLIRLRDQGHCLAVCTNKVTWHSRKLLEALDLSRYFSAICGRDAFAFCKPDPRHLTLTIAEAEGDAARAIMIGDSATDIETARRAGLPSICVDFGYTDIPAVDLGATRVISHFDELGSAIEEIAAGFARARA